MRAEALGAIEFKDPSDAKAKARDDLLARFASPIHEADQASAGLSITCKSTR